MPLFYFYFLFIKLGNLLISPEPKDEENQNNDEQEERSSKDDILSGDIFNWMLQNEKVSDLLVVSIFIKELLRLKQILILNCILNSQSKKQHLSVAFTKKCAYKVLENKLRKSFKKAVKSFFKT